MAERDTAEAQLERILFLVALASRPGGASLEELGRALEVDRAQLMADIDELTSRAFYHPPGSPDVLNVILEGDRLEIWPEGTFSRPTRLTPREALTLSLGLRVLAAEVDERGREELLALARRFEEGLTALPQAGASLEELLAGHALDEEEPDVVRGLVVEAVRDRRLCRIRYWKPREETPEERVIEPYVVVRAEGEWYTLGYCRRAGAVRIFRLDRIVAVSPQDERFEVPADFAPERYLEGGRVYLPGPEEEVVIRYDPDVSRWLAERGLGEPDRDGTLVLAHRVSNPTWLVRHVLRYGGDAVVLEPENAREWVREAASEVALGVQSAANT